MKKYFLVSVQASISQYNCVALGGADFQRVYRNSTSPTYGMNPGDLVYKVTFYYNKAIESFEEGFAARVYIRADTGKVIKIQLGNGIIFPIR